MMSPEECWAWYKYKMGLYFQRPERAPCTCTFCLIPNGVTRNGRKLHICDYQSCNKLFSKLQHLQNHKRSHFGERPYGCCFCEKRFFRHEELTRHKRSHTKEKVYACPQCTKCFTRSDYLSKHIDMHKRRALEKKQDGEAIPSVSNPDCNKNEKNNSTVTENNSKDDDKNEKDKSTKDI